MSGSTGRVVISTESSYVGETASEEEEEEVEADVDVDDDDDDAESRGVALAGAARSVSNVAVSVARLNAFVSRCRRGEGEGRGRRLWAESVAESIGIAAAADAATARRCCRRRCSSMLPLFSRAGRGAIAAAGLQMDASAAGIVDGEDECNASKETKAGYERAGFDLLSY